MEVPISELPEIHKKIVEFQNVHNGLKRDFLSIYKIIPSEIADYAKFHPLVRACLKELFSLMEADLYLSNQWNPYEGYHDREDFLEKFRKTFNKHVLTFPDRNRPKINLDFKSKNFKLLRALHKKRNDVTHPKGEASIDVTTTDLEQVHQLYVLYIEFIRDMFNHIHIYVR